MMIEEYKRSVVKALNEYRARHLHEMNELKAKMDLQRRIVDIQSAILNSVCQQRLPQLQQQPGPPAFAPVVHAILALATAMQVAPSEVVRALAVTGFAPAIGIAIAMPHLLLSNHGAAPVAATATAPAAPALPAEAVAAAASAAAAAAVAGKKRVIVVPPRADKRRRCAARPRLETRHSSGDSSISRAADDDAYAFRLLVDTAVLEAKIEAEKTMP